MPFELDCFTFNGAKYRFVLPDIAVWAPRPKEEDDAEWVHIPYAIGAHNYLSAGEGKMPVQWSPPGGIVVPTPADYTIFRDSAGNDFFTLTVPWGTETARLLPGSLVGLIPQGRTTISHYIGSVTWEWTP